MSFYATDVSLLPLEDSRATSLNKLFNELKDYYHEIPTYVGLEYADAYNDEGGSYTYLTTLQVFNKDKQEIYPKSPKDLTEEQRKYLSVYDEELEDDELEDYVIRETVEGYIDFSNYQDNYKISYYTLDMANKNFVDVRIGESNALKIYGYFSKLEVVPQPEDIVKFFRGLQNEPDYS